MSYISDIRKKVGHDPVFMPFSCGVIIKDNTILLQKRKDDGTWSLHGGSLELGETFEDALKRELAEELNIRVTKYEMICYQAGEESHHFYPNKDEVYSVGIVFLITDYKGIITPDNDEVVDLKWFPLDKLPGNFFHSDKVLIPKIINYINR